MERSYEHLFKIILLGDKNVGKSAILQQFIHRAFWESKSLPAQSPPVSKLITVEGKEVKLEIWDLSSEKSSRNNAQAYFKDAHAALIFYDITNVSSFERAKALAVEAKCHGIKLIFLVGNKNDLELERKVSPKDILASSKELGLEYYEVSAKTGRNVDTLFMRTAKSLLSIYPTKNSKILRKSSEKTRAAPNKFSEIIMKLTASYCSAFMKY